jgi:hypothetical protein
MPKEHRERKEKKIQKEKETGPRKFRKDLDKWEQSSIARHFAYAALFALVIAGIICLVIFLLERAGAMQPLVLWMVPGLNAPESAIVTVILLLTGIFALVFIIGVILSLLAARKGEK